MNRLDRHIPLEDRIWSALKRTCRLHKAHGHCPPCDERWAAIMLAISYERDLIQRHDAVVDTVVRDRITESKRAERYRLAWLSAKQGRASFKKLYEYAQGKWWLLNKQSIGRGYHDLMMRAYRNQVVGLEAALEECRNELAEANRSFAELHGPYVQLQNRVRELEAELADLRLAFSELEGAKSREESAPAS